MLQQPPPANPAQAVATAEEYMLQARGNSAAVFALKAPQPAAALAVRAEAATTKLVAAANIYRDALAASLAANGTSDHFTISMALLSPNPRVKSGAANEATSKFATAAREYREDFAQARASLCVANVAYEQALPQVPRVKEAPAAPPSPRPRPIGPGPKP